MSDSLDQKKKKPDLSVVWREAREIVWARRKRLAIGGVLMIVNRMAGMVMPASSKWLIDDVIGKQRSDLLLPLAAAVGVAAVVQGSTSFAMSQV
ncbi:MAG: ABC transporter ATP-binding protein, partial [Gemmatimonadota bacterium]|nr:ABC transporter ATP-binding protein [Gemmatimonadota bacterium]